jgi:hypothetical protein
MDFSLHRALVSAIPILIITGLAVWRRWLSKRNDEISAILQRRSK